jgi:hypothetical protein
MIKMESKLGEGRRKGERKQRSVKKKEIYVGR